MFSRSPSFDAPIVEQYNLYLTEALPRDATRRPKSYSMRVFDDTTVERIQLLAPFILSLSYSVDLEVNGRGMLPTNQIKDYAHLAYHTGGSACPTLVIYCVNTGVVIQNLLSDPKVAAERASRPLLVEMRPELTRGALEEVRELELTASPQRWTLLSGILKVLSCISQSLCGERRSLEVIEAERDLIARYADSPISEDGPV